MTIKKAVITAAGTGTRLLPFTKETPKEMLPIYAKSFGHKIVLKPILQVIFESIYEFGIRNYCFIVGRGKRSIEDHFLTTEQNKDRLTQKGELEKFFKKIKKTNLSFVQQPIPKGFGDAVLKAKFFVGNENFLLHAGDDVIVSRNNDDHLKRLQNAFFNHNADMAFLVSRNKNPSSYGVIEYYSKKGGVYQVKDLEEKPRKPKTNLAVIATYLFKPSIFEELQKTKPDKNGEIQLATAVKKVIRNGKSVAVELTKNERRLDVGTPQSYFDCINHSYKTAERNNSFD